MSWSTTLIGSPENVIKALKEQSEKMEGQSKVEFDDALSSMTTLAAQNFGADNPIIKLAASGHGYAVDGEQKQRNFTITIERIYGLLV